MTSPTIRDSRPITSALARLKADSVILSGRLFCGGKGRDLACRIEIVAPGDEGIASAYAVRSAVRAAVRDQHIPIAVRFVPVEVV